MPTTPTPSGPNSPLLVAAGLGAILLLGLLVLIFLRHQAPPPRRTTPAPPPAAASGPLAPVYSGGPPAGKRRVGF